MLLLVGLLDSYYIATKPNRYILYSQGSFNSLEKGKASRALQI